MTRNPQQVTDNLSATSTPAKENSMSSKKQHADAPTGFTYYSEPEVVIPARDYRAVTIGAGESLGTDFVSLDVARGITFLLPDEAREVATALTNAARVDEGDDDQTVAAETVDYGITNSLAVVAGGGVSVVAAKGYFGEDREPRVVLDVTEANSTSVRVALKPSDARSLGEALSAVDDNDDGSSKQINPRPGQTNPVSTPLDTLKHTVLAAMDDLDYIADAAGGVIDDEVFGPIGDALDRLRADLLRALGEHVEGINPLGHSNAERFGPLFPRYETGAPVKVTVWDGDYPHTSFPRLATRTTLEAEVEPTPLGVVEVVNFSE